jgi:hypothetical protein
MVNILREIRLLLTSEAVTDYGNLTNIFSNNELNIPDIDTANKNVPMLRKYSPPPSLDILVGGLRIYGNSQ